jgi:cell division septation protein DedD
MDIVEHGSTSKSKIMMSETLYMDACDFYLVFISNEYINNYPHNDEMNYILSLKKKKCIPVYLENVELPFDLRLFIGRNKNAVRKYEYDNEQDFYNELFGVGRLETQISEPKPELVEKPEPIEKSEPIEKLETVEKPEPVQKSEIVEEPEKTEPKLWEEGAPENTAFNESWGEDEKYIFASYAHNDKEVVMPILEELRKRGYRVWYDNNIIPGSEWPTEIANKILQCEIFMAFVSSSYNNSKNCGNELYYSAKYYKTSLIVYIEDIELPPGMDLTVSQSQAVYKFKEVTDDAFYKRLFAAKGISECRKQ